MSHIISFSILKKNLSKGGTVKGDNLKRLQEIISKYQKDFVIKHFQICIYLNILELLI